MANFMEPMSRGAVGSASKTMNSKQQMAILDQSKTVAESALQLVVAAKEGGGNPNAHPRTHSTIDEASDGTKETLQELIHTLEDAASAAGYVSSMIDNISKSIASVSMSQEVASSMLS